MPSPGSTPLQPNYDPTAGYSGRQMPEDLPSPIADPSPFGLTALALPLLALSLINIGWLSPVNIPVVLTTILIYGGVGQFVTSMWEVRRGNSFGVAAFGTFGLFNVAVWHFLSFELPKIPPAQQGEASAFFIGLWAIPALVLFIAALRTTLVVSIIFGLATLLFVFAAWGDASGTQSLTKIAGWIGIGLAATAWYGCASALTAESFGRVILPNPSLGQHH